jgi:glucose-6-phosphate isomerase
LELFSKYLQQIVMESIGKELDLRRQVVNQGLAVYGNKGSTDQHAYVQQLRDGLNNLFMTFIAVLLDRNERSLYVEPGVTSGDYLAGFRLGTREALRQNGRESVTLTITCVNSFSIGVLIALFERTVGFYASLINFNAYHQPGVEAGKKAAGAVIGLQLKVLKHLAERPQQSLTYEQIASSIGAQGDIEIVFHICEHLAANPDRGVLKRAARTPFDATYQSCSGMA